MLRPGWVWAGPMSQSLQGPVSWDTRALTSNQPWREQRPGETWSLTRRALTHRLFLCVCVCVCETESEGVSETSHFSVLSFSFLPLSHKANLLITGFERARGLKGQVTFFPYTLTAGFIVRRWVAQGLAVCTQTGLLYLHCQLCDWSNLSA